MTRVTAMTGLALLVAAVVTVAPAAQTRSKWGCARASVMKSVFPAAGAVGFDNHAPIRRVGRRSPYWKGWCGNWRTTYTGLPGDRSAFAQVLVSLYKTPTEALVALSEPDFGPARTLPNGVRTRSLVDNSTGSGASLVQNVVVSSSGCCGPLAHRGGAGAVRAQMRIHRRIEAAVLTVR
jgi:hypothetical protein